VPATAEFTSATEPFRRELLVHCYRMLGSFDEAEDLVQETLLRAWRSFDDFEGRSSVRTWLYRIATNACLSALEQRGRRPLPSGLTTPSDDPTGDLAPNRLEVPWLRPIPDRLWDTDPATIVNSRASVRLALIAALQHLPPRQRAALILRDVLTWSIPEIATLLNTTTAAVNSALQRARTHLAQLPTEDDALTEPADPTQQALLDRYTQAFATVDISALTQLLAEDAIYEMPPRPDWFRGRDTVARLIAHRAPHGCRLIPIHANSQPAFAVYLPQPTHHIAHSIQVLTLADTHITHVVSFHDATLFPAFDLPLTLHPIPVSAP
jgi:RNA polymerase sigma-70 factor (ECF subfamily)